MAIVEGKQSNILKIEQKCMHWRVVSRIKLLTK